MKKKGSIAITFALLAAALYALNIPLSKLLFSYVEPSMMAALLYLGAGIGMGALMLFKLAFNKRAERLRVKNCTGMKTDTKADGEQWLEREDLPYVVLMVVLDILAPLLLMWGLRYTNSSSASLLNNFEIVATALIALLLFGEKLTFKLWCAIALVTAGSIILGFEGSEGLVFNAGSLLVLGAAVAWGFENNCTRKISDKSSDQIVLIKGVFSGLGSLIIALLSGESVPKAGFIFAVLALGFVSYGLSIKLYVKAQYTLGAAKTSAFYSIAPFLGVGFGFVILNESVGAGFFIALAFMAAATVLLVKDTLDAEK